MIPHSQQSKIKFSSHEFVQEDFHLGKKPTVWHKNLTVIKFYGLSELLN